MCLYNLLTGQLELGNGYLMFDQILDQNIFPLVLGTDCPLQIASGNRMC